MTNMKKITFNQFCHDYCDRLYEPLLPEENQCNGYIQLKKMVKENIQPASVEEMKRWETKPTQEELLSKPDIKYMRFLNSLLRTYVIENWDYIKTLEID